jgi:UDP-glucose 4-epimerase
LDISRAVVTGGAGFIGSNVVDALVGADVAVLVVDDLSRGTWKNLEHSTTGNVELREHDIRDGERLASAFRAFRPTSSFTSPPRSTSARR